MRNERGFTLVEVLISIIILGVILSSFFQFFIFSQKTTISNQDKLVAINIAQKVLEQIKEEVGKNENIDLQAYDGEEYQENANNKRYSIKINITPENSENGLYMISVLVSGDNNRIESSVKGLVEL